MFKTLGEIVPEIKGLVEANSYEGHCIWKEYHGKHTWEQFPGYHVTIGELDARPVCLSLMPIAVDGQMIMLWDACSQVIDHLLIEHWLTDTFPNVRKTDAMNFPNVLAS